MWITGAPRTGGDVASSFRATWTPVGFPDPISEHSDDRGSSRGWEENTTIVTFQSAGAGQCCTVPTVTNLFWTGSCSKFWTDRGTSSVSNAASANAVWQRNASLGMGDCIVKMTSLGEPKTRLFLKFKEKKGRVYSCTDVRFFCLFV